MMLALTVQNSDLASGGGSSVLLLEHLSYPAALVGAALPAPVHIL